MFGGFKKTTYLCTEKVEKINILIIYADRKTAERSDAATCKNQAQPSGEWLVGGAADRGLGRELPSGGVGAKPLHPRHPKRTPECLPSARSSSEITGDDEDDACIGNDALG